jgi:hypothetical protein
MNYVASIFSMTLDAGHLGLPCTLHLHSESLITRGRNNIVRKFLAEEQFTHLFWIDSDIVFSPESVFRLLQADRDVAAGVYPMKNFKWPDEGISGAMTYRQFQLRYTEYPFNPIDHGASKVNSYVDNEGFAEVAEAPTGFMVIKRHVFTDMMKRYPELNYVPDGPPNHPQAHLHWRFFDCMADPDSGRYLSEDFAFCHRWRDMVAADRVQRPDAPGWVLSFGPFASQFELTFAAVNGQWRLFGIAVSIGQAAPAAPEPPPPAAAAKQPPSAAAAKKPAASPPKESPKQP